MIHRLFIISMVVLGACSKGQRNDCLTSLGSISSISRQVQNFTEIAVSDRVELTIVQDSAKAGLVELEGPKNLLEGISTEVENGRLYLKNNNTCNFVRSFDYELKVWVYVDDLTLLNVESIAQVFTKDTLYISKLEVFHNALSDIDLVLSGEEVYVRSLNSAQTTLRGKVRVLKGSIEEISNLKAFDLQCDEVLLDSHTPLNCEITAAKGIFVKLYNTGNIVYSSRPSDYSIVDTRLSTGDLVLKE